METIGTTQILVVVADNQNWENLRQKLVINAWHVDQLRRVATPMELQDVLAMSGSTFGPIVVDLEFSKQARPEFLCALASYREKISPEERPWILACCNEVKDLQELILQGNFLRLPWTPGSTLLGRILDEINNHQ